MTSPLVSAWHLLCRYLQAVAALVADADSPVQQDLLSLVAWFPATRLAPVAMHTAAFAWFWIMAAAPALTVRREWMTGLTHVVVAGH